jgi:phosphate transport system protein
MNRQFDSELQDLKSHLLSMGGFVEKAIEESSTAVLRREAHRFQEVHRLEKITNERHMLIDQMCFNLLARQAPVAKDLRLILAAVKINNDLERMGDQAVNIAYSGEDFLQRPPLKSVPDVGHMAQVVQQMVKDSLDAFVRRDIALSKTVLERDDSVDEFNASLREQMKNQMREQPSSIEACLDIIAVARNLERIADHATNICEEVIFLTTGDDIRHGHVHDTGS